MGNKLVNVASTEAHPPLANALRKLGRAWHSLSDLDQAQSISECVVIGDTFGYQGLNARSAKEALLQRAGVLEEYQAAVKAASSKRRGIERLKASSNIRPERVDEALEDLEEVGIPKTLCSSCDILDRQTSTSRHLRSVPMAFLKISIAPCKCTVRMLRTMSLLRWLSTPGHLSCTRDSC